MIARAMLNATCVSISGVGAMFVRATIRSMRLSPMIPSRMTLLPRCPTDETHHRAAGYGPQSLPEQGGTFSGRVDSVPQPEEGKMRRIELGMSRFAVLTIVGALLLIGFRVP